jgi:hypothetical protein
MWINFIDYQKRFDLKVLFMLEFDRSLSPALTIVIPLNKITNYRRLDSQHFKLFSILLLSSMERQEFQMIPYSNSSA